MRYEFGKYAIELDPAKMQIVVERKGFYCAIISPNGGSFIGMTEKGFIKVVDEELANEP